MEETSFTFHLSCALASTGFAKMKMIAAACEGLGIGKNGDLPWRLKEEMKYFTRMTKAAAPGRKNAVVMGRKTYESIPPKYRPLNDRVNVVLTKQKDYEVPEKGVLVCHNFDVSGITYLILYVAAIGYVHCDTNLN